MAHQSKGMSTWVVIRLPPRANFQSIRKETGTQGRIYSIFDVDMSQPCWCSQSIPASLAPATCTDTERNDSSQAPPIASCGVHRAPRFRRGIEQSPSRGTPFKSSTSTSRCSRHASSSRRRRVLGTWPRPLAALLSPPRQFMACSRRRGRRIRTPNKGTVQGFHLPLDPATPETPDCALCFGGNRLVLAHADSPEEPQAGWAGLAAWRLGGPRRPGQAPHLGRQGPRQAAGGPGA